YGAHHGFGTIERSAFRKLDAAYEIQLVLGRDEASRDCLETQPGQADETAVEHQDPTASTQGSDDGARVSLGAALKAAVEGPKQPAEQRVQHPRHGIGRRAVSLEQR